jgi:hypothetical protein
VCVAARHRSGSFSKKAGLKHVRIAAVLLQPKKTIAEQVAIQVVFLQNLLAGFALQNLQGELLYRRIEYP